ncbi:MFS transporter [Pendulispora rubella]|uniref:MFS transporter n=1 Tax=Pendulispora rubella TaxID=2741070 RepID=A0ABZ2KTR3_9BACT
MFGVLRHRDFRLAWMGYTASAAATGMLPTFLTLHVLHTQGALTAVGLVLGSTTAGFLVGALFGGLLVDRIPRRWALVASSALRGCALLAVVPAFDSALWLACACAALAGTGEGVYRSAYQATVAHVVPEPERQQANAATALSMRICLTGVPTAAVLLYGRCGGRASFRLAAALWLLSAGAAILLRPARTDATKNAITPPRRSLFADYKEGFAEALRHRWFLTGLGALVVWLACGEAASKLMLPKVSQEHFGGDLMMGIAPGVYSAGAVAGALLLARWTPRHPGTLAFAGLSLFGLVPLSLWVGDRAWLIVAAYALGGMGIELFNIPWFTALQREVPAEKLGRISALDFLVSYGLAPVGLAGLPYLFLWLGEKPVLVGCGLAVMLAAGLSLLVPGTARLSDPERDANATSREGEMLSRARQSPLPP